jgi:DNA replication factor GINS
LTAGPQPIKEIFEQRERQFLLGRSRVTMRSTVENIEVGDFKIESAREGEGVELPRWVAEELVQLKLADATEEPFETEVFKALSREKILGPFQLSSLNDEFYLRMRRRFLYLSQAMKAGRVSTQDYEKLRSVSYDLIGMRLAKLLSLSSSSTELSTIKEKLTPEERTFFSMSQAISKEWKKALLGDEK